MKLLDSNILIYSAKSEHAHLQALYAQPDVYVSSLSKVEVLGFHGLTTGDERFFIAAFHLLTMLPVSEPVINRATAIRRAHNVKTADAIIAATALELYTNNEKDFNRITGLTIVNPLKST